VYTKEVAITNNPAIWCTSAIVNPPTAKLQDVATALELSAFIVRLVLEVGSMLLRDSLRKTLGRTLGLTCNQKSLYLRD